MEIITRAEAIEQGLAYYYTGKPCKHGHVAKRQVTNHCCVTCRNYRARVANRAKWVWSIDGQRRKQARQAAIEAGEPKYYTGVPCKRGHLSERRTNGGGCIMCQNERQQREDVKKYKRKHKEDNRERYTQNNIAYKKKWNKANPNYFTMYFVKRNEAVMRATPNWVDWDKLTWLKKLRDKTSRQTGVEYHLDHYYPLQGKTVCGLNVPANIQIITGEENRAKHNKMPEEFYGPDHTPPTW